MAIYIRGSRALHHTSVNPISNFSARVKGHDRKMSQATAGTAFLPGTLSHIQH